MAKKHDRIGELIAKIRELGLSYKDGAVRFGVKPWVLYDYNRKGNRETEKAEAATGAEPEQVKAKEGTAAGPVSLPGDVGDLIRGYRRDHPSHVFKRIQDLLKQKHLVVVTRKQIRRELDKQATMRYMAGSYYVRHRFLSGAKIP